MRPSQALAAAHDPDDVAVLQYQDARRFLATKAISTKRGAFVLLVLGVDLDGKRPRLAEDRAQLLKT